MKSSKAQLQKHSMSYLINQAKDFDMIFSTMFHGACLTGLKHNSQKLKSRISGPTKEGICTRHRSLSQTTGVVIVINIIKECHAKYELYPLINKSQTQNVEGLQIR